MAWRPWPSATSRPTVGISTRACRSGGSATVESLRTCWVRAPLSVSLSLSLSLCSCHLRMMEVRGTTDKTTLAVNRPHRKHDWVRMDRRPDPGRGATVASPRSSTLPFPLLRASPLFCRLRPSCLPLRRHLIPGASSFSMLVGHAFSMEISHRRLCSLSGSSCRTSAGESCGFRNRKA